MIRKAVLVGLGVIVAVGAFEGTSKAQGVCVISERAVPIAKGRVAFPNEVPIPDASIELHQGDSAGPIMAQGKSDANGRFEFAGVKPGKYVLVAKSEMLATLNVPLRITSQKLKPNQRKELVIRMNGFVDQPCGGGYVELLECKVK